MGKYNRNAGYGLYEMIRAHVNIPVMGKVLFVIPSTDANYQRYAEIVKTDPEGVVRLYTTLAAAYDAATTNANDVIVLAGNATHSVTTGIAWSKNRIHVLGMDGGDRYMQQGSKVQNATADTTQYVIKVTGVRNTFRNIKFIQAGTAATCLTVLEEGGEGNLYKNCSFVFGVVSNLDLTTAHEVVAGSDSATFIKCTFGADTLLTSADRSVFDIDQVTTDQEFKDNVLEDCLFIISTSETAANLIRVRASSDVLFSNIFIRPMFIASVDSAGGVAVTDAVESVSGLVKGGLNFYMPGTFNCTNTATTSTALEVYAPATSNNAHEAVVPA